MKLNIYEHKKVVKTYEVDDYDIPTGIIDDLTAVANFDELLEKELTNDQIIKMAAGLMLNSRQTMNDLLKDMFEGITDEEIRKTTIPDIAHLLIELIMYTISKIVDSFNFGTGKNVQTVSK